MQLFLCHMGAEWGDSFAFLPVAEIVERLGRTLAGGAHPRRICFSNLPSKEKCRHGESHICIFGPSGEIRTPGILNPNQAPYQLGHTRKYKIIVLSDVTPYSRFAALSGCKQNCVLQHPLSNWATPGNIIAYFRPTEAISQGEKAEACNGDNPYDIICTKR